MFKFCFHYYHRLKQDIKSDTKIVNTISRNNSEGTWGGGKDLRILLWACDKSIGINFKHNKT